MAGEEEEDDDDDLDDDDLDDDDLDGADLPAAAKQQLQGALQLWLGPTLHRQPGKMASPHGSLTGILLRARSQPGAVLRACRLRPTPQQRHGRG